VSPDWSERAERGSPVLMRLMRWIALHLGRAPTRLLLYPITLYFLLFAPSARKASQDYLRRLTGRDSHWRSTAKHIFCFASTILDRVFLLSGNADRLDIIIHHAELVTERLKEGHGCVLIGSHLGSFEVLRAPAISMLGFPVKVLMQEDHNKTITRMLHALNPAIADTVIPLGEIDALLKAYDNLQQGYIIGMLADRVAGSDRNVSCEFLGDQADFPGGPWLAAAALKAPVILFFGLYRGGRRYDIHFELLAEQINIDRKTRDQDLPPWVQKYADRLAHYARVAPYNWFNFYQFWNQDD